MARTRRRTRRRSRRRRGGMNTDNAEFKAKMDKVATQANKTIMDANKALDSANKAKQDTMNMAKATRVSGIKKTLCDNPFMAKTKKCQKAAKKVEEGAKVLKGTSQDIKERANKLKAAGLKVGGRKKRRRRKSRKSRR